jgi:two-component system LytT family response regulator
MKIDCIIVEDEPLALERLKDYVARMPQLNLLFSFESGADALLFIKANKVDLVFLDINMDGLSGIQLLETSYIQSQVIITTAYDEYALKGFDHNVTDYLLKPFTFPRFVQAVEKAQNNLVEKRLDKKYIFIKTEYRLEKLFYTDIFYIEGMRDYRRIHSVDKKIMTLQTFSEFEEEIPKSIICRVHKSYMVSLDRIQTVEKDKIIINDVVIPISETYKKSFLAVINASR